MGGTGEGAAVAVTVVVVALGDDPRLSTCLEAVRDHVPVPTQVVVVENGVEGPGPPLPVPVARRIRRAKNPGFSPAVNEALAVATAPWILTLNPDASLHQGSFTAASERLRAEKDVGAVAFRLLRPGGEVLDSAGIRLGLIRRARDRGMGEPAAGRFDEPEDVDAACMAAALFRRSALESARDGAGEILDSRFFAYKEDVDLGWRLRRAGWRVAYEPRAVATHERGWREGMRTRIPLALRILSLRNRWLTILENESAWGFVARMALYVPVEIALALALLLREPGVLRAYGGVLSELTATLRRRSLRPGKGATGQP